MAFEIIQGFNLSANSPLDAKVIASSEAEMLAIKWVYKGLRVTRTDTSPQEIWICDVDVATNASSPYTDIGDWTEFTGTAGADGADGSQIYTGTGVPSDTNGVDGDFYINNSTGDYYTKASSTWGTVAGNLRGPTGATGATGVDGDIYGTVSSTSVDIPTSHPTTVSLTVATGLAYTPGQSVIAAEDASNYFQGTVTSYNSGTGALVLSSVSNTGTGSAPTTAWTVNLAGAVGSTGADGADGATGKAFIHTEANVELTAAKVLNVEGGTYTAIDPWSASIQNDTRSNKYTTAGILGDMSNNSIAYDGTNWYNNGRWLGLAGADGVDGTNGTNGVNGTNGTDGADGVVSTLFKSASNQASVDIQGYANTHTTYFVTATTVNTILNLPTIAGSVSGYRVYTFIIKASTSKTVTLKAIGANVYIHSSVTGRQSSIELTQYGTVGSDGYVNTVVTVGVNNSYHWNLVGLNSMTSYDGLLGIYELTNYVTTNGTSLTTSTTGDYPMAEHRYVEGTADYVQYNLPTTVSNVYKRPYIYIHSKYNGPRINIYGYISDQQGRTKKTITLRHGESIKLWRASRDSVYYTYVSTGITNTEPTISGGFINSTGTMSGQWGKVALSAQRLETAKYRVWHYLGHTNYNLTITGWGEPNKKGSVITASTTYVDFNTSDDNSLNDYVNTKVMLINYGN